jgi:hypothetical protein
MSLPGLVAQQEPESHLLYVESQSLISKV